MTNDNLIKHEILKHLSIHDQDNEYHDQCLSIKQLSEKINCTYEKAKSNCYELKKKGLISIASCGEDSFRYSSHYSDPILFSEKYKKDYWKNIRKNITDFFNISVTIISVTVAVVSLYMNYNSSKSNNKLNDTLELLQKEQKEMEKELQNTKSKVQSISKSIENLKSEKSKSNQKTEFLKNGK